METIRYCRSCGKGTKTIENNCRLCGSSLPTGFSLVLSDISALRISIKIWRYLAETGGRDKAEAKGDVTNLYMMNCCPCCEKARVTDSKYLPDCARCPALGFWPSNSGSNFPCEDDRGIYYRWTGASHPTRKFLASYIHTLLTKALEYHLAMKEMNL